MSEPLTWPFPMIEDDWYLGEVQWREITQDAYWQMLEVLPPYLWNGSSFLNSEPFSGTVDSETTYSGFCEYQGKYYARMMTRKAFLEWRKNPVPSNNPPIGKPWRSVVTG